MNILVCIKPIKKELVSESDEGKKECIRCDD